MCTVLYISTLSTCHTVPYLFYRFHYLCFYSVTCIWHVHFKYFDITALQITHLLILSIKSQVQYYARLQLNSNTSLKKYLLQKLGCWHTGGIFTTGWTWTPTGTAGFGARGSSSGWPRNNLSAGCNSLPIFLWAFTLVLVGFFLSDWTKMCDILLLTLSIHILHCKY